MWYIKSNDFNKTFKVESGIFKTLSFKYTLINPKYQFSKICDFITDNKSQLDYDWFIKIRPDIKLLEPINFNILSNTKINARARVYIGPKKIKYGMSINGEGPWKSIGDCSYNKYEDNIILDDHIFIFHNNVVKLGAFDKLFPEEEAYRSLGTPGKEDEWTQSAVWKGRNIGMNVIGINLVLMKYNAFSGDLNM